jgi:predicted dithiol-disulfide oxidoreductase (DUF899 family)
MDHRIGTREEWLAARQALLVREKELTRQRDALAAERRALPWVRIDKSYLFDSSKGKVSLGDLFDNRTQLMTYHFMFGPDWKAGCPGCSFLCDHVDAARQHFEHNNLSFAAVSRASVQQIEAYKKRMGWTFAWCPRSTTISITIFVSRFGKKIWKRVRSSTISECRRAPWKSYTAKACSSKIPTERSTTPTRPTRVPARN